MDGPVRLDDGIYVSFVKLFLRMRASVLIKFRIIRSYFVYVSIKEPYRFQSSCLLFETHEHTVTHSVGKGEIMKPPVKPCYE